MRYPRVEVRTDYDTNSYDTDYGGVVSNFTSSIYDDNPPLYPNPEILTRNNQGIIHKKQYFYDFILILTKFSINFHLQN